MNTTKTEARALGASFTFGGALAMVISWSLYKSIGWAIVHGLFGWGYVIYYAITGDRTQ